jgi:hypothetical protein
MNNVLDYHGYRFFQSFDPDEGYCIVRKPRLWVVQLLHMGYFMLPCQHYVYQHSPHLTTKLEAIKIKSKLITVFVLLLSFNGFAQTIIIHDAAGIMKTMWKNTREGH